MELLLMLLSQQKLSVRPSDLFFGLFPQKEAFLQNHIPHPYYSWVGSARTGLTEILSQSDVEMVGLPAFTCHVVIDAVKKAGKTPIFYDSGIIADVNEIKKIIKHVDALIVCYNFGFMPKMNEITKLCRQHNVLLIEDCAQALGARSHGKLAGSFGDFALYSFGLSKNISFCGGLITSRHPFIMQKRRNIPLIKMMKVVAEVLFSPFFFHPSFYTLTFPLLQHELNKDQSSLSYSLPLYARNVVLHQSKRYAKTLQQRRRNAQFLLTQYGLQESAEHSWLYLTLLAEDRERLICHLRRQGIDIAPMYTFQAFLDNAPLAQKAMRQHLTFALYRPQRQIKHLLAALNTLKNEHITFVY